MLHNLVHALHMARRYKDTLAICEAALRLPLDHTTPHFHAWAAVEHGLAGALDKAASHLAHSNGSHMSPHNTTVNQLANAITAFQTEHAAGNPAAEGNFLKSLGRIEDNCPDLQTDPVLQQYIKRACKEVSRKTGSNHAKLFAHFRNHTERNLATDARVIITVIVILYILTRMLSIAS